MADNPNPNLEELEAAPAETAPVKKKGVKRRIFLAGSALLVGGGIFGVWWSDSSAKARGKALIGGEGKQAFGSVMTIAEDDTVTVYSPHIDFGQGSHTALGQMLADELDADWAKLVIEQAPADFAFANAKISTQNFKQFLFVVCLTFNYIDCRYFFNYSQKNLIGYLSLMSL